jgi:hypothetical protein
VNVYEKNAGKEITGWAWNINNRLVSIVNEDMECSGSE